MKRLLTVVLILMTGTLYAQTEIGIAPGESLHITREHTVSILPITEVFINVHGKDSLLVGVTLDSFRIIEGTLKVKSNYTLSVSVSAPLSPLNVEVVVTYSAEGALTQDVSEDFIINTDVQPSIVADFSADPVEGSAPLTVDFINESFGNIIGYSWDFGDSTTSTEKNPQHTYSEPGIYTVSLTVFNLNVKNVKTREDYINAASINALGEQEPLAKKIFLGQNYPNPFNPSTHIRFYLPKKDHVEITLYDITGRLLKTLFNDVQKAGEHTISVDLSRLSSGVYFYNMKTNNFSATRKLIINK